MAPNSLIKWFLILLTTFCSLYIENHGLNPRDVIRTRRQYILCLLFRTQVASSCWHPVERPLTIEVQSPFPRQYILHSYKITYSVLLLMKCRALLIFVKNSSASWLFLVSLMFIFLVRLSFVAAQPPNYLIIHLIHVTIKWENKLAQCRRSVKTWTQYIIATYIHISSPSR